MHSFGLIGNSLEYSFSKDYFTNKFSELGLPHSYHNFECQSIEEVKTLLNKSSCSGFNVTVPFKSEIIELLDGLDESAQSVGAVNTVCRENSSWIGYNSDIYGFKQMIKPFFQSHHERALILGTGGASKAIAFVLEKLGSQVIYASRYPKGNDQFGYSEINELMLKACAIIVNTTPVGTFPNNSATVNIPYEFLNTRHLVIDLVYNPAETQFLSRSKKQGATVLNGLTMLHQQAEKSWAIWKNRITE